MSAAARHESVTPPCQMVKTKGTVVDKFLFCWITLAYPMVTICRCRLNGDPRMGAPEAAQLDATLQRKKGYEPYLMRWFSGSGWLSWVSKPSK